MVNAIQRHATLIVQKSLVEGFGITVAEGLWKSKPMVASAVGGIQDQIVDGAGVLLNDPYDLVAYGDAVASLLLDPNEMKRLGQNAHEHILATFIGDTHLLRYVDLIESLLQP
jgi:trehalose synthase